MPDPFALFLLGISAGSFYVAYYANKFPEKTDWFIEKYMKGDNSPFSDEAWSGTRQRIVFVFAVTRHMAHHRTYVDQIKNASPYSRWRGPGCVCCCDHNGGFRSSMTSQDMIGKTFSGQPIDAATFQDTIAPDLSVAIIAAVRTIGECEALLDAT